MKPDIDYTRRLLDVLEGFDTPSCDVITVRDAGVDIDAPVFFFHLRLLEDRGLLEGADPARPRLYAYGGNGTLMWTRMPMRLTAAGHDFAASLRTPQVMETIRSKAGEAAFSVWVQIAGSMASAYAMRLAGLSP